MTIPFHWYFRRYDTVFIENKNSEQPAWLDLKLFWGKLNNMEMVNAIMAIVIYAVYPGYLVLKNDNKIQIFLYIGCQSSKSVQESCEHPVSSMSVLVWVVCSTAVRPLPCQLSSCDNSGDRIATSQPFLHPLPLHEYNFLFILIHPAACGPAWGREQRGGEDEGITRMGQTLVRSMASSPAPPPSQNAGSNSVDRNPSPDHLSLCGWTFLKPVDCLQTITILHIKWSEISGRDLIENDR